MKIQKDHQKKKNKLDFFICKVRVIQKRSKLFFVDIFTWLDRARRALQNCLYLKNFKAFFRDENLKKLVEK